MWCSAIYGPMFPGAFALGKRFNDPEGSLGCGDSRFRASLPYGDPLGLGRGQQTFIDLSDASYFTPAEIEAFAVEKEKMRPQQEQERQVTTT